MLCSAHIQVNVLPVVVGLRAYKGVVVVRIHIAQIVG